MEANSSEMLLEGSGPIDENGQFSNETLTNIISSEDIDVPLDMDDSQLASNDSALVLESDGNVGSSEDIEEMYDENGELIVPYATDVDLEFRASSGAQLSIDTNMVHKPDISIHCKVCDRYVDLVNLREHKTYHRCLNTLKYRGSKKPESVEKLLKRRRQILKKIKEQATPTKPLDPKDIQTINEAFEFLKSDLEDTFEQYRRIHEATPLDSVKGIALNCSAACVFAVGICHNENSRWKNSMEDTRVFQDFFGNDPQKSFFALYDGHHGPFAADVAANELHHALLTEMERFDPRTKCTCTFNMADSNDISQYDLHELHSRPSTVKSERVMLHEESTNIIQQIIKSCQESLSELAIEQMDQDHQEKKEILFADNKDLFSQRMASAMRRAHRYTDILLSWGKDEYSKVRWSGCSTLTCMVQDSLSEEEMQKVLEEHNHEEHIDYEQYKLEMENNKPSDYSMENEGEGEGHYEQPTIRRNEQNGTPEAPKELGRVFLANSGNVHAVLVRDNKAYRLSKDHTPHNTKEKNRVLRRGGTISESKKQLTVNGVLTTTRGLGNHGDLSLKKCVVSDPHTTCVPIDQYAQFLIIASNGVWEVLSPDEAGCILSQLLPKNQIPTPSNISLSINRLLSMGRINSSTSKTDMSTMLSGKISATFGLLMEKSSTARSLKEGILEMSENAQEATEKGGEERKTDGDEQISDEDLQKKNSKVGVKGSVPDMEEGSNGSLKKKNLQSTSSGGSQPEGKKSQDDKVKDSQTELVDDAGIKIEVQGTHTNAVELKKSTSSELEANHSMLKLDTNEIVLTEESSRMTLKDSLSLSMNVNDIDSNNDRSSFYGDSYQDSENDNEDNEFNIDDLLRPSVGDIRMLSPDEMHREYARILSERLVQAALLAGARDNITAMVILLPGCGL